MGKWVKELAFFQPEPEYLIGYELCAIAKRFVGEKDCSDFSVAEMLYVKNDAAAGYCDVFVSHFQGETGDATMKAIQSYDDGKIGSTLKYFLDIFSIRQNVSGDFKPA